MPFQNSSWFTHFFRRFLIFLTAVTMGKPISLSLFYSWKWFFQAPFYVHLLKFFQTLFFMQQKRQSYSSLNFHAPYESGDLKMIYYESMVKALHLSWLKRIFDKNCNSFWKHYFNDLLEHQGGQFLLECNYSTDHIDIPSTYSWYGGKNKRICWPWY